MRKDITLIVFLVSTAVWLVLIGGLLGYKVAVRDNRKCDDIVRYPSGELICEIHIQAEDDR